MNTSFLSKPYPFTASPAKRITAVAVISVFITAFLFVFRPFGLNHIQYNILWVATGYGAVTFIASSIVTLLLPVLFPSIFNEEKWNTGSEIVSTLIVLIFISAGNLFFSAALGFTDVSLNGFIAFISFTFCIAVMPVTAGVLIKQNYLLRKNLKSAMLLTEGLYHKNRLNNDSDLILLSVEGSRDEFRCKASELILIKAAENYVEVFFNNGTVTEKKLIRNTLKNAHDQLKMHSQFYRCHRTCIVNMEKVDKVSGNAQGYRLILRGVDESIPVSRQLNKELVLRLKR